MVVIDVEETALSVQLNVVLVSIVDGQDNNRPSPAAKTGILRNNIENIESITDSFVFAHFIVYILYYH